jgi:single-stranded DNA-binding protein
LVGIKGRIQTSQYEQNDEVKYVTEVVVEKVTFLSTKIPEADK